MHRHMSVEVRGQFLGFGLCLWLYWGRQGLSCFCCYMLHCLLRPLAWELLGNPLGSTSRLASQVLGLQIPTIPLGICLFSLLLNRSLYAALAGQEPTRTPSCPWLASQRWDLPLPPTSPGDLTQIVRLVCTAIPFTRWAISLAVLVLIILVISLKIILTLLF